MWARSSGVSVLPPPQLKSAEGEQPQPLRLAICRFSSSLRQHGQVFRICTGSPAENGRLRADRLVQG
jgi:hypothetical protein